MNHSLPRAVIKGIGAYLPERIVTNRELETRLDTTDAWITERTGIRQRHIAADNETTSDLATAAARAALAQAGITASQVDLLLLATTTPDDTVPSTASRVQYKLGMGNAPAVDLNAACAGFVYGLATAQAFIASGMARTVLLIGAETFSRILDWNDRGTCILFGDGAGATVLTAESGNNRGVLHTTLSANGTHYNILRTTGGVATTKTAGVLTMAGKEVFRHAVAEMGNAAEACLEALSLPAEAVDWVVPHQANQRIMTSLAKHLNINEEKVISTVGIHANTSAASIPLALAASQAKFAQGNLLLLPALGAGLTWGCCAIRV